MKVNAMETFDLLRPADDDDEFFNIVSGVLHGAATHYKPEEIYIIRIRNWFGRSWLKYPAGLQSSVGRRWFASIVCPPFHPHRVEGQLHFQRVRSDSLRYEQEEVPPIHVQYELGKDNHCYRALNCLAPSAVFLWYNGTPSCSERAALMLYRLTPGHERAWYASFLRAGGWNVEVSRGISLGEFMLLASGANQG